MSPEICNVNTSQKASGKLGDVWALGITFYCFTFLDIPFNGESIPDIMENIQNKEFIMKFYNIIRLAFP